MRDRGLPNLESGAFGENVVVEGVDLAALGLGSRLRLGDNVEVSLTQLEKISIALRHLLPDRRLRHPPGRPSCNRGGDVALGAPVTVVARVPRETCQAVVADHQRSLFPRGGGGHGGTGRGQRSRAGHGLSHLRPRGAAGQAGPYRGAVEHYCDGHSIDLVVAVGGTGFAPRDVTPEAAASVIEQQRRAGGSHARGIPGEGSPHTPCSHARCAASGAKSLMCTYPGSERAARENIQAILPALPHGLAKLRGDPSDCGRPSASGGGNV